ncbi:uracil-DNA glycosylase [Polaromonas sp. SM01]|uniref:uracil-DNA glycosylase n=1 Tax=Polaromonas sp. SM01 TaxID=3085630 RepID=UPI002981D7EB|nr:uracil-DNA glycosylase [Polaromonas sp. SM01]MDW5441528.1 uracil-DNA glycosylase [Polaromonas sp. SM01]
MSVPQGLQADLAFDRLPQAGVASAACLQGWNPTDWPVAADWSALVTQFLVSSTGQQLGVFVSQRLAAGATIYPAQPFRALELTPLAEVKVVILGQDPYHGLGQAHGLAFSVAEGVKTPPSLRNIFKELARDPQIDAEVHTSGKLERWARQGVLLLNTGLTVEDGQPASHAKQGWELLTDQLISAVSARPEPVVFLLWGAHAQAKQVLIDGRHRVLTANHPSPLSALRPPKPFLGCGHFSAANDFLRENGFSAIQW